MRFGALLLVWFLLTWPVSAAEEAKEIDLVLLKQDTRIFEGIVHEILQQNFPDPFALTGEAEGSYLQGYGIVVSFHLNINRAEIRTPFGLIPTRTGEERSKEEQLSILKESMVRVLADYGGSFRRLDDQSRIAITARVEDRSELDSTKSTVIMVMSVLKKDVELLAAGQISRPEFESRVRVLQY